jgi:hypothetical protein
MRTAKAYKAEQMAHFKDKRFGELCARNRAAFIKKGIVTPEGLALHSDLDLMLLDNFGIWMLRNVRRVFDRKPDGSLKGHYIFGQYAKDE